MTIRTRLVEYHHDNVTLQGFFAWDDSKATPQPGVLISHSWVGRDEFVCRKAIALAEAGHAAFALDMYGAGKTGSNPQENELLMKPFMQDRTLLQGRILSALHALRSLEEVDANKIAAIGFCFGGLCVLDLARTGIDIQGVASFHGLLTAPENIPPHPISARILALHGHNDPLAPPEHVTALQKELTAAGADWQTHVYSNTVHAFTNPLANDPGFGTVYNPAADRRSWTSLLNFLHEVLK
ncbi:dienelactone hydrolase family protein [Candidatus Methylospira mobilis]|uniref:Dienelactone hydrolase family protein n=1 Tax=Candidatus Methylospira mobilis TaxID=1808979 RepID=A0A5Q0BHN0_9GAMM|nr:dienelactone hydrolase family protein [Candidatus Methylospira mobilis]QFY41664.1 dienelactone hydrolase family protein [Candidatus Methylospira mobilis]WNV05083.1 dienelactone hydrolase family protein [Candidatus Methylospira mobilis]